jgi:hypothetical protein
MNKEYMIPAIRTTEEMLEQLKELADADNRSLTGYIRDVVIFKHLKNSEKTVDK